MSRVTLGAAVVGLGVGEQHAIVYAQSQQCVLRSVYDLDAARMKEVLDRLGQGAAAESFEAVLSDSLVNIVSIASYDDAHFQQLISALAAGKHVFVEKPLCRSFRELHQVKKAWQESGHVALASNLVLRAAPLYSWLKDAIRNGVLGEIYAIDGDYLYGRLNKITHGWRKDVPHYSVIQGGGIHLVDIMLWLTQQRPKSVTASGNRICTVNTDFRYNDYVSAVFEFSSGLIGRITANFGCVHRHQHVLRVFGTEGTFIYDDQGPRLHTNRDSSVSAVRQELSPLPASKGDLIPRFVRTVLNGEDTRFYTQHEFDLMSVCITADQALAEGKTLEIDYI